MVSLLDRVITRSVSGALFTSAVMVTLPPSSTVGSLKVTVVVSMRTDERAAGGFAADQAKTPEVSCMRALTSPR